MAFPSARTQYFLELTNRMRLEPESELDQLLSHSNAEVRNALDDFNVDRQLLARQWQTLEAAPPLAWSSALHQSAETHSHLMVQHDRQSHNLPGEPDLLGRLEDAGYNAAKAAENIFAYPESVFAAHAGFAIDWGDTPTGIQNPAGHRMAILNPNYRDVGIAIVDERNPNTDVGSLVVTQHFGLDNDAAWSSAPAWLVGVVYRDRQLDDDFYTPGEGLAGVRIEAEPLDEEATDKTYQNPSQCFAHSRWRSLPQA